MKKKVFSKLLMVALVATVGAFTSCKDYDDDINDLRSKVDGLNTSLTTLINDKVTSVSNQVTLLEKQLGKVEESYAAADAALQKELDGVEATGIANGDNIKTLLAEVADLKTAKTSLENAIKELKDGLANAQKDIKGNSDNIITLLAKDTELEKGINDAKAAAKTAFDEATKALNKANDNANSITSLQTKEQGDFDNLQKQITDNLTSVTAEIGKVNTALNDYIKLNNGKVAELDQKVADQKADITAIQTKLVELATKDTEILDAIDKAKAAQKEINDAQATKNEELAKDIRANAAAIKTINETTLPQLKEDLINHTIPEEVAKQIDAVLEDRLQAFLESDVTDLVEEYYNEGMTIVEALDAKVDSIDEAVNEAIGAAFGLACLYTEYYTDSVAGAKAIEAKNAFDAADDSIRQLVEDSIGKVAKALEIAQSNLSSNFTTLNEQINGKGEAKGIVGQIATLEEWFKPAGEGSTLTKLEKSLIENEEVIAKVNDIVAAANGEINSMITSINLFAGPHGNYHNSQDGTGTGYDPTAFDHSLIFTYAIEKGTEFPWAAMQGFVDDTIKFTNGNVHTYSDSILVRVSPVNAVLDKDFIALINSQGQDIVGEGIVEVESVEKYKRDADEYLTAWRTRGTNAGETGLWVIKFKIPEGKDDVWAKFQKAAFAPNQPEFFQNTDYAAKILYAVGVKNTKKDDAEDNRYVVSEYDLDLGAHKAFHVWDYDVNGQNVAEIHNRYIVNENKPNSTLASKLWTDDKEKYPITYYEELTFAPYDSIEFSYAADAECYMDQQLRIGSYLGRDKEGNLIVDEFGERVLVDYPGYTYEELVKYTENAEAGTYNVIDRYNHKNLRQNGYVYNGVDNRDEFDIKTIQFNRVVTEGADKGEWADIEIEFPNPLCETRSTEIAGFFVMLDQNFARESNTSEVAAWTQYIYKNVGFRSITDFDDTTHDFIYDTERKDEQAGIENGVRKAHLFKGNKGTISIKNARGAKGDVIGFRVYAVNLDGTLYDPDGRAFYVKVGDPAKERVLNFVVEAFKQYGDAALQNKDLEYGEAKNISLADYNEKAAEAGDANFFNISEVQIDRGSKYYFKWTWAGKNPVIRTSHSSGLYEPADDSQSYLTDVFSFQYTEEGDAKVDIKNGSQWHGGFYTGGMWDKNVPGYRDINNIKVTLQDAARLQNDSTYHLKCVVTMEDPDGATSVVNTIYVNVTKKMPSRLPKEFKVREGQVDNAKDLTFYMRPKGNNENNDTWNIFNWFTTDKDILGSAYSNYGFDFDYKVDGKDHSAEVWGDEKVNGRATRATAYQGSYESTDYRWATDVRPYNYEEIFHGLIPTPATASVNNNPTEGDAYYAQFDQNYSFYYPGCGSYGEFQNAYDKDARVEAVNDTAVTYFRSDSRMYPSYMTYRGLNTDKNAQIDSKMPGYYLPFIYYENVKENTKGVKVPVMAAYTFKDINFVYDKVKKQAVGGVDYVFGPVYFDKDGNTLKEADKSKAAFQVKFECALDPTFTLTAAKDSVRAFDARDEFVEGINGKLVTSATKMEDKLAKAINYGNKFLVSFDSVTVAWKSNKAAYEYVENTAASYFRTNFGQFAQNFKALKFPKEAVAYHQDTCWIWSQNKDDYGYKLYDKNGRAAANHIAIVGAAEQPAIADITLKVYKEESTTDAQAVTADINHYFEVKTFAPTYNGGVGSQNFGRNGFGTYGLQFIPKTTSLDPTKIHRMKITVKSSKPTLVHQWGHTTDGSQASRDIWVKNPASTPQEQGARRSR